MNFEHTYYIVPFVDVTQEMIDKTLCCCLTNLRHSITLPDNVILKTDGYPNFSDQYEPYTCAEILDVIVTDDWQPEEMS